LTQFSLFVKSPILIGDGFIVGFFADGLVPVACDFSGCPGRFFAGPGRPGAFVGAVG
jgi:hypothetical protein